VDVERRRPVAARHQAGNLDDQPALHAGEVGLVEAALVDADAGPGLAVAFGRRRLAERQRAGAENRATARQDELAPQTPGTRHSILPQPRRRRTLARRTAARLAHGN